MDSHTTAIQCRGCNKQWRIQIALSGNEVEAFATICECGALIVGNYAPYVDAVDRDQDYVFRKKYLSNGHFDFLQLNDSELEKLPLLQLE